MKRLLIANRGEIALRIQHAARDLGIETVAVYAESDRDAPFAQAAAHAFALGGDSPAETYLDGAKILNIARVAGADAIHPGYGFLSENVSFAQAVIDAGLIWVGPAPAVIATLGDKLAARDLARHVGAPLAKGSAGPIADLAQARECMADFGLPVIIKAAHGGGGRGMRIVRAADDLAQAFAAATREAETAFGRGECFIEQYLERPRHIEVQVLADQHGTVLTLGTRDCTLQRRNQKLLEEAPAPTLSPAMRAELEDAARALCTHAQYTSAGTVEFLVSQDGTASFLEVNTRVQVEHPVTEEVYGLDIVAWQLRIARGEALPTTIAPRGHAIEMRINAEDPGRGFLPTPGQITALDWPTGPGVRVDSGVCAGQIIAPQFDSLIAKIIVTGPDRQSCIARARRALAQTRISGIATTLAFHRAVLEAGAFTQADGAALHTRWIEDDMPPLPPHPRVSPIGAQAWEGKIQIDGRLHHVVLPKDLFAGAQTAPKREEPSLDSDLTAPFAAKLVAWQVADGAQVETGQVVATIEAMKAEHHILASRAGVLSIKVTTGAHVAAGDLLGRIS